MDVDGRVSGAYCRVLIPQRCRAGNRPVQRSHACTGVSPQGMSPATSEPGPCAGLFRLHPTTARDVEAPRRPRTAPRP
ncbi:hypothetical protein PACG_03222, partial [Pseudomonas aeruginosa C3719]